MSNIILSCHGFLLAAGIPQFTVFVTDIFTNN